MAVFEIIMPKMGESVIEATIIRWLKREGDTIKEDEPIAEIATDKVDSEIPSPVEGVVKKLLFKENDIVAVGRTIAIIDSGGSHTEADETSGEKVLTAVTAASKHDHAEVEVSRQPKIQSRFYSPLVRNIARQEGISFEELDQISGSGKEGRVTKADILNYLQNRKTPQIPVQSPVPKAILETKHQPVAPAAPAVSQAGDEIIEMDRMRRLIADHMVSSVHTSPHVTSFIEVDLTNVVKWRESVKDKFLAREGEKITLTPIFIEAAARALKEFPNVNASVEGYNIIRKKNINIGMATALPNGNLIVPVIRNADQKNLLGITKEVNSLAAKARNNQLSPDDIQGGTFTITNLGTFGSLTGTPIINQPQVAILGIGVVRKKPVVMELPHGDVIAIRHMMILSLSYDHRIVDGMLGGLFIKRIAEILENFDPNREI